MGSRARRLGRFTLGVALAALLAGCGGGPAPAVGPTPGPHDEPAPEPADALGRWWVSGAYPAGRVTRNLYPHFYAIFMADWRLEAPGSDGWVALGPPLEPEAEGGSLAMARTVIRSPGARTVTLRVGYSEEADVFLNARHVHAGRGGAGGAERRDTVVLELEPGLNEILLMVAARGPRWGFAAASDAGLAEPPRPAGRVEEVWATDSVFLTPETVVHDPLRDLLYVSSFDNQYQQRDGPSGYISRMAPDGRILEREWITGLDAPTGMALRHDTLYVAERTALAAVDVERGRVMARWPIPDTDFPNDVAADSAGSVYISDTRPSDWPDSRIYRFRNGRFDVLANAGISRANGLVVVGGDLYVGSSGDGHLVRVDLATGRVEPVVSLGAGIIDGMRPDGIGGLLVSHWEGRLYRIAPDGAVTELLDTGPLGLNLADFAYLPERRLLVVPTFLANRVVAYRLWPGEEDGG